MKRTTKHNWILIEDADGTTHEVFWCSQCGTVDTTVDSWRRFLLVGDPVRASMQEPICDPPSARRRGGRGPHEEGVGLARSGPVVPPDEGARLPQRRRQSRGRRPTACSRRPLDDCRAREA